MNRIQAEIDKFDGVTWSSCGVTNIDSSNPDELPFGWVKFGVSSDTLGWRTLEFIAWVIDDMRRANERIEFTPTAPPPYLNEPGDCLSFVIECFPLNGDQEERFGKVAEFIQWCRDEHWEECAP
jgi:hypothetical protein